MLAPAIRLYRHSFSGLSRDIWLLSLVMLVNRAGTMVIPFLTIYLTGQKGFRLEEAGWVMSSFGLGSVLGAFIGGKLTDRIGYYPVQFWSLTLGGFCFLGLQFVNGVAAMCAATFVLSTIADAFRPANQTAVAFHSRPENRSRAFALVRLAVNLGFSAGPVMGGLIAHAAGYQWLFVVDALTCFGAALIFRLCISPKKAIRHSEDVQEKGLSPWRDGHFLRFILFITLGAMAFMQFMNTLPIFWKTSYGFSEAQIGALTTLNGLIIVSMEMPLAYLIERKLTKLAIIGIGTIFYGVAYFTLSGLSYWAFTPILFMIFLTIGEMLCMPFASAYTADQAHPSRRGQYMGIYTMAYSAALIIGPSLSLWTAQVYGFIPLWFICGGLSAVSAAGILLLKRSTAARTVMEAPVH